MSMFSLTLLADDFVYLTPEAIVAVTVERSGGRLARTTSVLVHGAIVYHVRETPEQVVQLRSLASEIITTNPSTDTAGFWLWSDVEKGPKWQPLK